jgi:hypothetical protein
LENDRYQQNDIKEIFRRGGGAIIMNLADLRGTMDSYLMHYEEFLEYLCDERKVCLADASRGRLHVISVGGIMEYEQ